ncbi:Bax inhibitor-1/YccA family protein [Myxococcus sp. CA051A]|uniref:Bax inhibitor-1/YccA family protein n=1 Tax=Myxococcus llanfairpwllgwyngyllgogerychwyrndrobwllllantysiliogogogochensis TaxID=2590453 RepID=A0A540WQM6_9BACT|nr:MULTISPECIES: Bax inhibitor-1/YccA family protein [Myxococcus]NTX14140.1 Bax inhibitor-1/YccA family protein [Myxococcus sp. CA056]NTX35474.1 Bax inhibitor-1/YccA family protein [Myxococcus sp. CA033]NTX55488.1 Bax inhibitor-1/YccA family protein [Myxococcus sp. CA039A]NTX62122.1 Bax inhibitor-1/YccA family protein [Myxococcus sp. CA051A]TQF11187.1 Bax inhibitor-1/YccA family protein [Myxococcus llanfairpwllgwyngyllgogerychwyrndrobwllllantysiliogogogochensis]
MAWETSGWQTAESDSVNSVLVQESKRAFMTRVHGWMFAGLLVTGVMAMATLSNEALLRTVINWRLGLFGVQLVAVLGLSFLAPRLSGPVAAALFLGYSALTGMTLSVIFLIYTAGSIAQAFFLTAGVYGAMAIYGTVTKKDLSAWGTFLFMGLIGVVLAGVVNIFVRSDMVSFVGACAAVLVFSGLTAYDTQKLREMHANTGYSSAATVSIVGALTLYLDFINLFLAILRLLGRRR